MPLDYKGAQAFGRTYIFQSNSDTLLQSIRSSFISKSPHQVVMEFTPYQSITMLLSVSTIMPNSIVLLLGTIMVSNFLFKFGTKTTIERFWNTITFTRLLFILLLVLKSITDIPDNLKDFVAVSAAITDIYNQTIKVHKVNTKLLAAIGEDGLPLIRQGPERQELQSLQKYSFVVVKMAMVVGAIFLVSVGVVIIAATIDFVSTIGNINSTGTL
ncbi:hypothetical protein BGAL_0364g00010 [Botrytis galanthina]|uniref:Uncharacterized protein n=1 Tax=Botrytis galanthina TaxID=278940 RepID=A0A4S8QNR6_9HELO|nr:hypothetical protein BGAL_0364g00010 [Botrytis galanthina]